MLYNLHLIKTERSLAPKFPLSFESKEKIHIKMDNNSYLWIQFIISTKLNQDSLLIFYFSHSILLQFP